MKNYSDIIFKLTIAIKNSTNQAIFYLNILNKMLKKSDFFS